MIVWPDESRIPPAGREGLQRFRETGAFDELESSRDRWEVASWPWTLERPLRVQLENQAHEAVAFTLDDEGLWRLEGEPRKLRLRSPEAIAEDEEGAVLGLNLEEEELMLQDERLIEAARRTH